MKLPISDYFTGQRALDEEIAWIMTRCYQQPLNFVLPRLEQYGVKSVIEWGCRSGLIAQGLPKGIDYMGLEDQELWRTRAEERNPGKLFLPLYQYVVMDRLDLSMSFSSAKHWSLDEWDDKLSQVLSAGRFGCFNMQLLEKDLDNGTEFHHVYVTPDHLQAAVEAAGHEMVDRQIFWEGHLDGHGVMRDVVVWTKEKA